MLSEGWRHPTLGRELSRPTQEPEDAKIVRLLARVPVTVDSQTGWRAQNYGPDLMKLGRLIRRARKLYPKKGSEV